MKNKILLLLTLLLVSVSGLQARRQLTTVPYVDVNKYMGKWYEIASFPQKFQDGCSCTTAEYSLNANGTVTVRNSCNKDLYRKVATATAYVKDKQTNAKLAVEFFPPFKGKYWIIDLADDYSYAVVGHPKRKYLWILSRTSTMNETLYNAIVERAASKGFDISKLNKTMQCDK
ncbi:MAG: hypothetical protein EOO89_00645 [Pedobacter sp.]|nr:MAG: hypothetical protein EOO89_00645 [Pedobacter sp.]